ncbi:MULTISPECIES: hypothetical protein [unclassified Pseudoalteromonas]|uniref:hypothetical protein n=1 Tax=unclassified Pseudoalteromonas TaxID=194690 RepID=UPI001F2297AE|nr:MULTISPECIES: hypothetical protein [unclassified Pseudoalteromonas]MCF2829721.1 hypothetical protein [Pseudoalteromonas sp. OF5H-5]MCF2832595.1 hypothetical protein [Pseudoalteromonas sp. DL2-H6]MCF2927611.1 hypothetical protein [Pseudoalteromonas sp. DL2-H1]
MLNNLHQIKDITLKLRIEQLRELCDDFLKNESDEFYSKEDKVIGICCSAKNVLEQACIELKQ